MEKQMVKQMHWGFDWEKRLEILMDLLKAKRKETLMGLQKLKEIGMGLQKEKLTG